MMKKADVIITMGCSAEQFCPAPLISRSVDWELDDPKGKNIEEVRRIRDQIEKRVLEFLNEL